MAQKNERPSLSDIRFVKAVPVGGVNPNNPLSDELRERQVQLLNRCLQDYPKGILLGSDITVGRYTMGQHELVMQRTVYHVGFTRKPTWLPDSEHSAAKPPMPGEGR